MKNIIWAVATGFVGALVAKRRNLNPIFWFAICSMLGHIALLGFIFLPFFLKKSKKKEAARAPQFVISFDYPLESHWYHLDEKDHQNGPFSFLKLQQMMHEGKITEETYIWNDRFTEWKLWKSVFPLKQG